MKSAGYSLFIFITLVLLASMFFYPYAIGQDTAWVTHVMTHVPALAHMPPVNFTEGANYETVADAKKRFKNVIGVEADHEEAIYLALAYYPELAETPIEFVFKPIGTTMSTRPAFGSFFKRSGNRTYQIFINNKPDFDGILFGQIPFNGRVGIVAHELAHLLDYECRSSWGLAGVGIKFLNRRGRSSFEKTIDLLTIHKGLGWQLRDWAHCSMGGCPGATPEYQAFKRSNYLSAEEVVKEIEKLDIYRQ
ncbi:MAG: hypothetical protein IT258_08950 [Saprospiraceae bacterium]|nr:hypothetical protein [Saprospiraceae bacterium]